MTTIKKKLIGRTRPQKSVLEDIYLDNISVLRKSYFRLTMEEMDIIAKIASKYKL